MVNVEGEFIIRDKYKKEIPPILYINVREIYIIIIKMTARSETN